MSNALVIRQAIDKRMSAIVDLARSSEEAKQIIGTAMLAVGNSDKLAKCEPASVVGAIYTAVRLGLEVNTPRGLAYFVPRETKKGSGIFRCNFQIGYRGMLDLAYRAKSQHVASVSAYVVKSDDEFDVEYGLAPVIRHKPKWTTPASKRNIIAAYAVAMMKNGQPVFQLLNADDLENIAKTTYRDGEYYKYNYPEWAKARAIKRLMKYLPQDGQFASAIDEYDDRVIEAQDVAAGVAAAKVEALPMPATRDIDDQDAPATTPAEAEEFAKLAGGGK